MPVTLIPLRVHVQKTIFIHQSTIGVKQNGFCKSCRKSHTHSANPSYFVRKGEVLLRQYSLREELHPEGFSLFHSPLLLCNHVIEILMYPPCQAIVCDPVRAHTSIFHCHTMGQQHPIPHLISSLCDVMVLVTSNTW